MKTTHETMNCLHHSTRQLGQMEQQLMDFDGPKITKNDKERLSAQFESVLAVMRDGKWRSDAQTAIDAGFELHQVASVGARRRDMRKKRFWPLMKAQDVVVNSRRTENGYYEYQLKITE